MGILIQVIIRFIIWGVQIKLFMGLRAQNTDNTTPMPKAMNNGCLIVGLIMMIANFIQIFISINASGLGNAEVPVLLGLLVIFGSLFYNLASFYIPVLIFIYFKCKINNYAPADWIVLVAGLSCFMPLINILIA